MRLVGRILFVGAVATLSAVVAVIGCAVDSDRFAGIKNDVPNSRAANASGSSSTSTSSGTGPVPTLCQCAATFVSADAGDCGTCATDAISTACSAQQTACNTNNCTDAISCVINCAGMTACVAGCIKANSTYAELINCQCMNCSAQCSAPSALDCNLGVGGAGGGGGNAGTGGTGGAGP